MADEVQGLITINGIPFTPIPEIKYKNDYVRVAKIIDTPELWEKALNLPPEFPMEKLTKEFVEGAMYRHLILTDLWFIVYFVIGIQAANHPFWVKMAQEVENGPKTKTLDVWSRAHGKSSLITIAETVQYHLKNPEHCTGIFSFKRPAAEDFLDSIRKTFEKPIVKFAFPDAVYQNPQSEADSWSLQNGITLRRKNTARKEATIEASGLIEGMATGKHFERRIFDDIETSDVASSIDEMNKCFSRFEMSAYLGTGHETDIERVIGTFYNHSGPLCRIRDKQNVDGSPVYYTRIIPATEDGTPNGKPVLLTDAKLEEEKTKEHYFSQMLCDPTPKDARKLNSDDLDVIDPIMIPLDIVQFLVVDPAGDNENGKSGDSWGIMVIGINVKKQDELGASDIYIMKAMISPLGKSEAVEEIARMYLSSGVINAIGIEKQPGAANYLDSQIQEVLKARGKRVDIDDKSLVLLPTGQRIKKTKILNALDWRFKNRKIHISNAVPRAYIERIKMEMDKFPYWKDDALDTISYFYDLIKEVDLRRSAVADQYDYSRQTLYAASI